MKKHLFLPLVALLSLSMAACTPVNTSSTTPTSSTSADTTTSTGGTSQAGTSTSDADAEVDALSVTASGTLTEGYGVTLIAAWADTSIKTAIIQSNVTFTSSDTTKMTIDGNTATCLAAGEVTVTATYVSGTTTYTGSSTLTIEADDAVKISEITAAGTYVTKGVLVGKTSRSCVINDGTGSIYIYDSTTTGNYEIGDYLRVEGTVSLYSGCLQFGYTGLTVTEIEGGVKPTIAEATELTTTIADSWATGNASATTDYKLYKWTSIAGMSGSYLTLPLDGSTTTIEPTYLADDFDIDEGSRYAIEGYYIGYNTSHNYATIVVTSATPSYDTLESISINAGAESVSIGVGQTAELTVTPTPASANPSVTWTTSDSTIATVGTDGVVTGVAAGTATITATSTVNTSLTDTITVTVTEEAVITAIKDITEDETKYYTKGVVVAKSTRALVIHDGTAGIPLFVGSGNAALTTYAIGDYVMVEGTTSFYNGSVQFGNSETNPISITKITDETAPTIPEATELTSTIADSWVTTGDTPTTSYQKYKWTTTAGTSGSYITLPVEGSSTVIEYSYLDTSVYTIEAGNTYNLEAYYVGYNTSYKYATVVITSVEEVAPEEVTISLDQETAVVAMGSTITLTPTVKLPTTLTDTSVTWTTSDSAIATVADGVVTGVAAGTATITATSVADTTKSASCVVTVTQKAGETQTLTFDSTFNSNWETISTTQAKKTQDGITFNLLKNSSSTNIALNSDKNGLSYVDPIRVYKLHSITFTLPTAVLSVTTVSPTSNQVNADNASVDTGTLSTDAIVFSTPVTEFTLTASGAQIRLSSITFTYVAAE